MTSTKEKDDMDKLVQSACEAAARGDAAKVIKCLHSPSVAGAAIGLDEPLFRMSTTAQFLLENLNSTFQNNPEHVLRALMSIPCSYETPWRAALSMIAAFHSQSGTLGKQSGKVLWTCVTDVQTFLQLTVEAWWKQERQRTSSSTRQSRVQNIPTSMTDVTPRHLLEQLSDAILQPLNDNENISSSSLSSRDNQHWTQPLELVTTIVSTCQDLEPSETNTLSRHVLNRLFPSSIRPDRLLPWLTLVSDLRSHLQSNDWTQLYDILQRAITQNTVDAIPPSDLPGLVRGIVSFLVKQQHDEQENWELLILHLLHSASHDATTYSTVETVLKSSCKSLPNPVLCKCLDSVNASRERVPNWICSNMNLLLLQAVQQSGSLLVSNLVSRALGGGDAGGGSDLQRQCWESLKELSFPSDSFTRRKESNVAATIKATLDGVYYQGNGNFAKDGDDSLARNVSSKLVCESIFLGKTKPSKQSHHVFASERAQLWVHAADTILRPSLDATGPQNSIDVLFAILIMVTVYCEVPASRSTMVRSTMQYLSAKDGYIVVSDGDASSYHCVMVAMIVGSLGRNPQQSDDAIQELQPFTGIFGESLTKDVFCDLTSALSPLSPARSVLLSISRKFLQSTFGGNLWWDVGTASRGMQENRDRIDCALHGLCTLLVTTENQMSWDDCGTEAWMILSEVLVQNKPALPMSERSALFRRLSLFTERNKFSLSTIEHLMRVCLIRFLQFFDGDNGDSIGLIPERVFVAWGSRNASSEASACVSPREDVVGLLRLVMLFLEQQAVLCDKKEASAKEALRQGRDRILLLLSDGARVRDNVPVTHPPLASDIVCSCLAAILRSTMFASTPERTTKEDRRWIEGKSTLERWREHLVSDEIEECKTWGMVSDPENRFSWLKLSSQEVTTDTGIRRMVACDMRTKNRLLSSLCDVVLDLIFRPVWSNDAGKSTDEERKGKKRQLTKCTLALISLKRDLSNQCDGGIHVKDSGLTELSFDSTTLCASAVPVLELCSHFFCTSLSQGASLDAVEGVLLSLVTYCSALKELSCDEGTSGKALDERSSFQIARKLWELYRAICEETSARRLLRYLEEKIVAQLEAVSEETRTSRSLLIIRTDEDVDAVVQRVRLNIVSTIGAWFQALPDSSKESSAAMIQVKPLPADPDLSTSFWVQVLGRVSSDVKTGLDGESGGMTEALYTAYLSLMESVCKVISLTMPRETDVSRLQQVSRVALECETRLKEVLCTFPLKGATQFKKTMMLSISEFPSLQRQATVLLASSGEESRPTETTPFAAEVFYQMICLTERQHRLGKLAGTTWSEIAGPEHVGEAVDDESSDDDSMDRDDRLQRDLTAAGASSNIPSMIAIPDRETRRTTNASATSEQKVQLPSKESWIWASCCSLLAMEQIWVESYSLLNGNAPCNSQPSPAQPFVSYYEERTKSLSNVIKAACFAMKSFKELKDADASENQSKEDAATILATSFADAVKVRFCMILEKISAVLQIALRSVSSQFKKGEDDVSDLIRAESMACMSAWLSVEAHGLDLESLSKRWYHAEKQPNEGTTRTGGIHKRLSPSLRRLPKFLVRTQELETDLSKLYQMLGKIDEGETAGRQQQVLAQYDSLLDTQTDDKTVHDSLQSMIKAKLKSLAKARASSEAFNLTLVGKVDNDAPAPRKRTRKAPNLERQMRRERRRNVKRSRNQVVDEWLHLDDEYDMEEGVDDDAYVDLEDFIV